MIAQRKIREALNYELRDKYNQHRGLRTARCGILLDPSTSREDPADERSNRYDESADQTQQPPLVVMMAPSITT